MICYPNAKINLGLKIISKRTDGFHNISSFFLPIPLFDVLEAKVDMSLKKNKITYSGIKHSLINNDLVLKAYDLLNNNFKLSPLRIHLHKNIPIGSGLGGGSSDGVFMLNLLNNLFCLKLSQQDLLKYSLELGSDCPFFIFNTFSNVTGLGNEIEPVNYSFQDYYIVIIKPNIHCSTSDIFSQHIQTKKTSSYLSFNSNINTWKTEFVNDLEHITFSLYPELQEIKEYLYSLGAVYASMSGSGSAVYGLFHNPPKIKQNCNN